jgi:hypothetical protein
VPTRLRINHKTPLGVASAALLHTGIAKAHAEIKITYVMFILLLAFIWID